MPQRPKKFYGPASDQGSFDSSLSEWKSTLGSPQTRILRDEYQPPRRALTARLELSVVQIVQKIQALLRPSFQAPGSDFFLLTSQCFVKVLGKLPFADNPGQLRRYRAVLGPTVMSLQVSAFF